MINNLEASNVENRIRNSEIKIPEENLENTNIIYAKIDKLL